MNIVTKMQSVGISRWLSWLLIGLGVLLVVSLIFDAGLAIGARRSAGFHGDPRGMGHGQPPQFGFGGFGVDMPHGFLPDGHGAVGTITSINGSTLTITTRTGETEEVVLDTNTQIQSAAATVTPSDLQVGQEIVALGDPREATSSQQLKAVLIRVLPAQPMPH